jgi:transcriptional regulator with XRE-family HTH domain
VEFSERLLRARTAAQKTQEQVAHACGLSHAAISKAESGKTESMGASNLFAIADFLGCNARWLATGEGEMRGESSDLDALTPEQRTVVLSVIKSMK